MNQKTRFDMLNFRDTPTRRDPTWQSRPEYDMNAELVRRCDTAFRAALEHDPEKCAAVFRKDHARTTT
jgi:hypothetical protein